MDTVMDMAKRKRAAPRTVMHKAVLQAAAVATGGAPNEFHWADPLYPPFIDRRTPHSVALTYEEWFVYTCNLMGTGLWQH